MGAGTVVAVPVAGSVGSSDLRRVVVGLALLVVVVVGVAWTWVLLEHSGCGKGRESRHMMHCSGSIMMPIAMKKSMSF